MATPSYQAPPPPPSYQVSGPGVSEPMSGGMKILLYLLSFFIPVVGFIVGFIYYTKPNPEERRIGKNCIILAVIAIIWPCLLCFLIIPLLWGAAFVLPWAAV